MNLPVKLHLAAALFLGLLITPAYSRDFNPESIPMITVHYADSYFIQEVYAYKSPNYVVRNFRAPVEPTWGFDGYLYRIDVTIILDGENFLWNKPLHVRFTFENGDQQTKTINEEKYPLYPNKFYHFSFDLKTYVKGQVRIDLLPSGRMGEDGIRFYGNSVCLR